MTSAYYLLIKNITRDLPCQIFFGVNFNRRKFQSLQSTHVDPSAQMAFQRPICANFPFVCRSLMRFPVFQANLSKIFVCMQAFYINYLKICIQPQFLLRFRGITSAPGTILHTNGFFAHLGCRNLFIGPCATHKCAKETTPIITRQKLKQLSACNHKASPPFQEVTDCQTAIHTIF